MNSGFRIGIWIVSAEVNISLGSFQVANVEIGFDSRERCTCEKGDADRDIRVGLDIIKVEASLKIGGKGVDANAEATLFAGYAGSGHRIPGTNYKFDVEAKGKLGTFGGNATLSTEKGFKASGGLSVEYGGQVTVSIKPL